GGILATRVAAPAKLMADGLVPVADAITQFPQDEDAPMCAGDDRNCPQFDLHRQKLLDDLDAERRAFLKSAFVATGGAAALGATGGSLVSPAMAQSAARPGRPAYHYLPANADTVHWGYFSKL